MVTGGGLRKREKRCSCFAKKGEIGGGVEWWWWLVKEGEKDGDVGWWWYKAIFMMFSSY